MRLSLYLSDTMDVVWVQMFECGDLELKPNARAVVSKTGRKIDRDFVLRISRESADDARYPDEEHPTTRDALEIFATLRLAQMLFKI